MVFDVPSPIYIPSLTSAFETHPFYKRFLGTEHTMEHTVYTIFHLCGEGVLEDDRYKSLLSKFAPGVHVRILTSCNSPKITHSPQKHIVSSRQYNSDPVTFSSAAFNQARLNKLDAEMFPVPKYRLEPIKRLSGEPLRHTRTISFLTTNRDTQPSEQHTVDAGWPPHRRSSRGSSHSTR